MADEVTFIDLATLVRITPDTTLEKLGSAINASIYDASNIAGSLKQKGLIDFSAYYPGPTTVTITDGGKALIAEADAKSTEQFDHLDTAILAQLSGGKRIPVDLQTSLNLRPKDLALRLYKLSKQGLVAYSLKSGDADISLTEAGFLKAKASEPPASQEPQQPQQQKSTPPSAQPQPQAQTQAQPVQQQDQPQQAQPQFQPKPRKNIMPILLTIVAAAIIIAAAVAYRYGVLHI